MAKPRVARRRRNHRAAVLSEPPPARSDADRLPLRAVLGTISDAGPQFLALQTVDGEFRIPLSPTTSVWHGGRAGVDALHPGRQAIVRPTPDGLAAEQIWVDITRVIGTITDIGKDTVEVDAGPHRSRTEVVIEKRNLPQVLVRHPRFEPGHLIDLICVRSPDGPRAVRPGTAQHGHHSGAVIAPATPGPIRRQVQGTITWWDGPAQHTGGRAAPDRPADPRGDGMAGRRNTSAGSTAAAATRNEQGRRQRSGGGSLTPRGLAYPAVDPEGEAGGCSGVPVSCAPLPYLSRYSDLFVRNDCTQRATTLQVIECGCVAARYCDRCVECGISPRGRIAELTAVSFVELGGDLAAGCFNATLTVG